MQVLSKNDFSEVSDELRAHVLKVFSKSLDKIENVQEIVDGIVENFAESTESVQLSSLMFFFEVYKSGIDVKNFRRSFKCILELAYKSSTNIFLKETAILYWRVLDNSLKIVPNSDDFDAFEIGTCNPKRYLNLDNFGNASSLLGQLPESFCTNPQVTYMPQTMSRDPAKTSSKTSAEIDVKNKYDSLIEFD